MENFKNKITELKNLGFSEKQVNELLEIGEEEIMEDIIERFSSTAESQLVDEYITKLEKAKENKDMLQNIFNEIMGHLYGPENLDNKKTELLIEYIDGIIKLTKESKELYKKYEEGDPEAVKKINEAKDDPMIKEMIAQDDNNGK